MDARYIRSNAKNQALDEVEEWREHVWELVSRWPLGATARLEMWEEAAADSVSWKGIGADCASEADLTPEQVEPWVEVFTAEAVRLACESLQEIREALK